MTEPFSPDFQLPPQGMLSEKIDLPDHRLSLGLLHIDGAGIRICAWDGEVMRHMALAAARRWASDLAEGAYATAYKPVVDAVDRLNDRVDEINAMAAARRAQKFDDMPVEGHA